MYNSQEVEKKWQERWATSNIFQADPDPKKVKKLSETP